MARAIPHRSIAITSPMDRIRSRNVDCGTPSSFAAPETDRNPGGTLDHPLLG